MFNYNKKIQIKVTNKIKKTLIIIKRVKMKIFTNKITNLINKQRNIKAYQLINKNRNKI